MDALAEQVRRFGDACRAAGLKLTHQRLEIFRELARSADHPSAEALHQRLRQKIPTLSLDTVYRTLATFARHGMITKVETVESQGRFEVTLAPHHHLICGRCNTIMDFQWPSMDEAPSRKWPRNGAGSTTGAWWSTGSAKAVWTDSGRYFFWHDYSNFYYLLIILKNFSCIGSNVQGRANRFTRYDQA
ncbi:Fur family transcriptional regulator [Geobacter sp. FeAm09]|uniref:Fur family transcriptional regulator n=1 Tax=Geobacter sp. FeAm09 TaxID=2597769 RepID=UPI001F1082F2|nr:Fur family transcriptional regulator [Geobacter sp. FeAm09]